MFPTPNNNKEKYKTNLKKLHVLFQMAAAIATTAPLISLTHPPSFKLLHFSANNVLCPLQPFPSRFHYSHRSSSPIIRNCHGKLNSSSGGEPYEMDESIFGGYDGIEEDESDEEDTESSVDLFIRFLQSMFKKVSKRAKKASRSVLPTVISPQLTLAKVSFAVDGTLLLATLSIVKALLEVICTLGATVFAAILLLRVIWAAVSYLQSSGNSFNQGGNSFGAVA